MIPLWYWSTSKGTLYIYIISIETEWTGKFLDKEDKNHIQRDFYF